MSYQSRLGKRHSRRDCVALVSSLKSYVIAAVTASLLHDSSHGIVIRHRSSHSFIIARQQSQHRNTSSQQSQHHYCTTAVTASSYVIAAVTTSLLHDSSHSIVIRHRSSHSIIITRQQSQHRHTSSQQSQHHYYTTASPATRAPSDRARTTPGIAALPPPVFCIIQVAARYITTPSAVSSVNSALQHNDKIITS